VIGKVEATSLERRPSLFDRHNGHHREAPHNHTAHVRAPGPVTHQYQLNVMPFQPGTNNGNQIHSWNDGVPEHRRMTQHGDAAFIDTGIDDEDRRITHDQGRTKRTGMTTQASIATPSLVAGWKRQEDAASTAAPSSAGFPDDWVIVMVPTVPSARTNSLTTTRPSEARRRSSGVTSDRSTARAYPSLG